MRLARSKLPSGSTSDPHQIVPPNLSKLRPPEFHQASTPSRGSVSPSPSMSSASLSTLPTDRFQPFLDDHEISGCIGELIFSMAKAAAGEELSRLRPESPTAAAKQKVLLLHLVQMFHKSAGIFKAAIFSCGSRRSIRSRAHRCLHQHLYPKHALNQSMSLGRGILANPQTFDRIIINIDFSRTCYKGGIIYIHYYTGGRYEPTHGIPHRP